MEKDEFDKEEIIPNKKVDLDYEYRVNSRFNEWSDFDKNIKNFIPLELIDICKALFTKFSKGTDTVESKDLMSMLRLLDLNPSEKEVKKMLRNLTPSSNPEDMKDRINLYEFLVCVAKKKRDSSTIHELLSAFKMLDKEGSGKIPEPTLRFNLCKKGEYFSNEEMDAFMKEAAQFVEVINDVKYLNYSDYALFLKDMYVPKEVIDPKKVKKGGKK